MRKIRIGIVPNPANPRTYLHVYVDEMVVAEQGLDTIRKFYGLPPASKQVKRLPPLYFPGDEKL